MKKKRFDTQAPDLYFIENATDGRGRRVLTREGDIENWIWPPGPDDMDETLLSISEGQSKQITAFFAGQAIAINSDV